MAVLAADLELEMRGETEFAEFKVVNADIIYKGSLVSINSSGWAAPSTDSATEAFVGIAVEQCDNSAGAAGAAYVKVFRKGQFKLTGTGLAQADVGREIVVSDDNTVTDKTTATNDQVVGTVIEYLSATSAWVDIGVHTPVGSA